LLFQTLGRDIVERNAVRLDPIADRVGAVL
jgi:hypothetical protein